MAYKGVLQKLQSVPDGALARIRKPQQGAAPPVAGRSGRPAVLTCCRSSYWHQSYLREWLLVILSTLCKELST